MSVVAARGDVQRDRWIPRLARLALLIVVVVGACGFALAAMRRETGVILGALAASAIVLVFSWLGILIAGRKQNPVGLIFSALAVAAVIQLAADDYILRGNVTAPGSLPLVVYAEWVDRWIGAAALALLPLLFLLFPTGRIPSVRWRWVFRAWAVSACLWVAGFMLTPGPLDVGNSDHAMNPFGVSFGSTLGFLGGVGLLATTIASIASLFVRWRHGTGEERQQLRLLVFVAGIGFVCFWLSGVPGPISGVGWAGFLLSVFVGIPAAIAIAILKYRLYDVDVVIRKTVVFGILAAFITAVYVAVVVGLGSLFTDTLVLRIAATALVAVAFQPVRDRANRLANRLVYGDRATPYEVLARFGERVGETYASEDVLPRIARVIAEGTAAARSDVWLRLGDRLTLAASWPVTEPRASFAIEGEELPPIEGDRVAPVRHQGELLGAIAVTKPASEPLSAGEAELLDHLAEQAGLVLANARLTADLEARLMQIAQQAADLRSSRQRIVAAQDEERRRLERNIHDGAQQHLVALAVKLRLAKTALQKDPALGRRMLGEIQGEVDAALDTLRSLVLGIYPPLLEEQGIAAALAAQYVRSSLPVRMEADGIGRYPIELEAAVYFCALEALQNAAKYANATAITIAFRERDGALEFSVADDGGGFDPGSNGTGTGIQGMRDRMAVFGGDAEIESSPGRGTIVRGRVPVSERVR
ncbi:MAG TPA: histidine kinase [Actinomycetota bacterium]